MKYVIMRYPIYVLLSIIYLFQAKSGTSIQDLHEMYMLNLTLLNDLKEMKFRNPFKRIIQKMAERYLQRQVDAGAELINQNVILIGYLERAQ